MHSCHWYPSISFRLRKKKQSWLYMHKTYVTRCRTCKHTEGCRHGHQSQNQRYRTCKSSTRWLNILLNSLIAHLLRRHIFLNRGRLYRHWTGVLWRKKIEKEGSFPASESINAHNHSTLETRVLIIFNYRYSLFWNATTHLQIKDSSYVLTH